MAQYSRDLLALAFGTPLPAQPCAYPIGQKAQAHMIDHPIWPAVMDWANLQVTLEFTEGFLHVQ